MSFTHTVPKIPLYKARMEANMIEKASEVLVSGQIAGGPNVEIFENLLRNYLGNPLVTTNGDISTALAICLFQAGVRPGDEVLMSPLVCLATSCPVRNLFANIRWCDVNPLTGNIDPADLEKRITPASKAVIVYHWAGSPAELDELHKIARAHDIPVIEDAGEALGAEYHGKKIGASGSDFAVFSFYPNRHLTTIEGAAISCLRTEDFENIQWIKRYGIHQPSFRDADGEINPASDIPTAGWNSYLSNVSAAIGIEQMKDLSHVIARYQGNGLYYDEKLSSIPGITVLTRPPDSRSSYWVYTFLAQARDRLLQELRRHGVYASKVHLRNDKYSCFGKHEVKFPGVDYFSEHCISIPSGWWVTDEDRQYIANIIESFA